MSLSSLAKPGERVSVKLRTYAKDLRAHQTEAEQRLWYHLRANRFFGIKFKRQVPQGPYIADFISLEHRLVIELDGGQHNDNEAYDNQRDQWFVAEGFTVLRFWNHEVMQQTEAVLEQIRLTAERATETLSPTPLPQAGEGT
ncbi:endonuclease domain-containing protein [Solimonas sp. K1W22B-7]|uniref:endonuclease domain-containing protein n=1 Tax=Solimonas sp. K1W22B-7 TaxID=2303331 RepID=UPI000E3322A8|nr:endonuclease domain-containing protein [Solimonas sp. K1W22B-7]AXQ28405.1 endonuclease domain-containing protein [Solimonas sp. K1W22B-7]